MKIEKSLKNLETLQPPICEHWATEDEEDAGYSEKLLRQPRFSFTCQEIRQKLENHISSKKRGFRWYKAPAKFQVYIKSLKKFSSSISHRHFRIRVHRCRVSSYRFIWYRFSLFLNMICSFLIDYFAICIMQIQWRLVSDWGDIQRDWGFITDCNFCGSTSMFASYIFSSQRNRGLKQLNVAYDLQ